jgi:drug/metabolite transporter (DMT)-like permease
LGSLPGLKTAGYAAIIAQTLISAATFLVAKDATHHFGALGLAWFRIELSGVLAGLVVLWQRRIPDRRDWPRLWFLGVLGIVINQTLFLLGLRYSVPLHSALLYAFTPILVLIGAVVHLGERLSWSKGLGVLLAFLGVLLVLLAQGLHLSRGPLRGDLITLVAVFAWSAYTVAGKSLLTRYDAITATAWIFLCGAIVMLPVGFLALRGFDPAAPGTRGWLDIGFLSLITSGVAFTLWYVALAHLQASQVAVFSNLQAPLTALLAWLVLDQTPDRAVIAGGVLVLGGVILVQLSQRPNQAQARPEAT